MDHMTDTQVSCEVGQPVPTMSDHRSRGTRWILLIALLAVLDVGSAQAQWGLVWDVQIEDEDLRNEILGYLQSAGEFYERRGFPVPYLTDDQCRLENPVQVVSVPPWPDGEPPPVESRCGTTPIRYCREEVGSCKPGRFTIVESALLANTDARQRKDAIGRGLFRAVMEGYDWFRKNRPDAEPWFTSGMAYAGNEWWQGNTSLLQADEANFLRAYLDPLSEPLGKTSTSFPGPMTSRELAVDPELRAWMSQSIKSFLWWRILARMRGDRSRLDYVLAADLRDDWALGNGTDFYLDLLDLGLHQYLAERCESGVGNLSTEICKGLYGSQRSLTIRYLDVEETHESSISDGRVGGMYFYYPVFSTQLVEAVWKLMPESLERLFPGRPVRAGNTGCIQASFDSVESTGYGDGTTRQFAEINLSIPPVAFDCVEVSDLKGTLGANIWIRSSSEEIVDQIHLSHSGCARSKHVIAPDALDSNWNASWMLRKRGPVPSCNTDLSEVRLIFTNVAKRASETVLAEDLRIRIYPVDGEAN